MGLARRILSLFMPKKEEEEEEKATHFLQNGGELLVKLIAFSNGQYDIPIRSFAAKELGKATNDFSERVFANDMRFMPRDLLDGRQILVNNWSGNFFKTYNLPCDLAIRDIVIASQMSHLKNVLKFVGCCLEFESPTSVYEYVEGRLLSFLLVSESNINALLSRRRRLKIASDIARTVLYLHTAFPTPVIYRDLKPSKVIIDQHGVAKLFDFSLSISLPPGELHVEDDVTGTFGFLDPEYHASNFVTQKTNVYSFGVFLLVLLTGKSAFYKNHEKFYVVEYVKHYVDNHQYDEFIDPKKLEEVRGVGNDNLVLAFLDLALICTQDNREERLEMIDVAKQLQQMEKGIRNHLPSISS